MWWPTQARSPRARQNVFFSSAPQASSGARAATGQRQAAGHVAARAAQEHRPARRPRRARTESSVRVWIWRSWTRNSRRCRPAVERVLVAEGDRLVRDVPAGHAPAPRRGRPAADGAAASRAASRRARARRARPLATGAPARRGPARSGAAARQQRPLGVAQTTSASAAGSVAAISANGLSSRCLRARSGPRHARRRPDRPGGSRRSP